MLKGKIIIFDRLDVYDDPLEWEFNIQCDLFELCKKQFGKETALYLVEKWWGKDFAEILAEE